MHGGSRLQSFVLVTWQEHAGGGASHELICKCLDLSEMTTVWFSPSTHHHHHLVPPPHFIAV
jgi:hypothetical protein